MALHVAAQDKVKLSGRVIDDEQNPVLFAVVKVDGQAAGTTTDLQGRYQLEFSTADTVTVSFSMIGYVTKKKTLVRPKGSLRLNITLQTQSIDMGEVTANEFHATSECRKPETAALHYRKCRRGTGGYTSGSQHAQ